MTLGQKLKEIRKKFGLSQEQLAEIINVSRQAITKLETDAGLPDTENLKELSRIFEISINYLLDNNNELPLLVMKKKLDKDNYKNKISSYEEVLKEYYPAPWKIYILTREKKMSKLEGIFDFILYFETVDRKTFCYTADGVYEIALKLYEIEEKYENTDYIRISKSSIVNLNKIKSIRPDFGGKILATMENNEKIYISRQYVPILKKKLGIGGN